MHLLHTQVTRDLLKWLACALVAALGFVLVQWGPRSAAAPEAVAQPAVAAELADATAPSHARAGRRVQP